MRILTVILALLLTSFYANGQKEGQALIDSLVAELPKAKNDTLKGRLYKRIAEEYFFIDTKSAIAYARRGLAHVQAMRWERGIGVFNLAMARAFSDMGNVDSCMYYNQRALEVFRHMGDTFNMATTYNNIGVAQANIASNYPEAIRYYLLGLKEAEKQGDKYLMANANDNVGSIYLIQKNYPKALLYSTRALKLREQLEKSDIYNTSREVGNSLNSLGSIYYQMKDTATSRTYFGKAVLMHERAGNVEGLAKAYGSLAVLEKHNYNTKLIYARKSEKLWNEVNPAHIEAANNLGNIGSTYLEMYKSNFLPEGISDKSWLLKEAERYLRKAIKVSEENGDISYKSHFTGTLAEVQEQSGDFRNAYYNFRTYKQVEDSLYSQEEKNKIAGLEGEREIALRDKQIRINTLELEARKRQQWLLTGGVLVLAAIGGLLYRQSRLRKRTNVQLLHLNNELDEANQVKARFFAILSHDLRSPVANLVNFLHLQKEAPDLMSGAAAEMHQKRLTDSAESLLETMESMLLWSKSQMQQFRPQARRIAVDDLFEYIRKFFSGTEHIAFTFENADGLAVVTDEDYLRTIMQNLTHNAVKALKTTNNPQIHWAARAEGSQVVLSVTDNGPGASEEQLNALYDDHAAMGIKSGLGLHLIRDLARAISCQISAQPNAGNGMKFSLSLTNI
ncbi:Signal transduction histidine kinase [Dyadobacter sp. SG02]|uniref:tetratricopeptide repeat-containing sensor histidine kinase n=1 Tax=Dyadobacter sp. SG02 TaxID=1855291 RepID=UPI0008BA823F|nr:tetratricopeptide repeat-containing sensor histidine kinase [Dyadobacter sp. SG02]SEI99313.1 Signal transduction histidine kinase [Dyadobacter sp. SG02]